MIDERFRDGYDPDQYPDDRPTRAEAENDAREQERPARCLGCGEDVSTCECSAVEVPA